MNDTVHLLYISIYVLGLWKSYLFTLMNHVTLTTTRSI